MPEGTAGRSTRDGAGTPGGVPETATVLRTLERGMLVLEAVAAADGTATAKALSSRLGIRLGTCYHLLRTLLATGYVVRLPGGRYDVGPRAASLSRHLQRRSGPSPELAVILTRLHTKTQETSYLSGWYLGALTLQHYLSGPHSERVSALDVGYTAHMHARAGSKAVLAFLPDEQVAAMFQGVELTRLTPRTITGHDALLAELARIRRQRYAVDMEEFSEGVACVSAPFFDAAGSPAGAYTVSAPVGRFRERQGWLTTQVREASSMATGLLRTGRLVVPSDTGRTPPAP